MTDGFGERTSRGNGRRALARGSWTEARALFEEELERRESAEALEGLSWAAWWLDDAATVFEARRRAYRLYARNGDPVGAARMAVWLASDHLDFHGAVAVAFGWLQRAERLLAPLEPGPDHGWLAFHSGYVAQLTGDTAAALELGERAADIGRRVGVADLEMLGLGLQGAALIACARVADGMRCLDEATALALAEEAVVPISSAWTCCFLVSSCTAVLDYERAFQWCDRIAEFSERYGSRYMLAYCRASYGQVHLWRGRWTEADELLEQSIADFAHSRPAWAGEPTATLAELRRRQGRTDEAIRLLESAGTSAASALCRARIALGSGESRRAVDLCRKALRLVPPERELERAPALEGIVRAHLARGEIDEAEAALAVLRALGGEVGTVAMAARIDVAEGLVAAARGDHDGARIRFEDAADGFDRCGAPYDAAEARLELATSLSALGRPADAEREAVAARDRLAGLGAKPEADRAGRLLSGLVRAVRSPATVITRREREVLAHVAAGLTNREIAGRLVVSEHTVHRHVANILRKLDVPSRTAAAAYAVRAGIVAGDRGR